MARVGPQRHRKQTNKSFLLLTIPLLPVFLILNRCFYRVLLYNSISSEVNILGSQICALLLNLPLITWFIHGLKITKYNK
jgi:hypothetical protein